jgi:PIN domain nuclease of toxin-antitoxin system
MAECVVDASAILALLHFERGADKAAEAVRKGVVSVVNLAEVWSKLFETGHTVQQARQAVGGLTLKIADFTAEDAFEIGRLRPGTRAFGLSLGDRACLALALRLSLPVITADRRWAKLDIGATIELIR